MKTVFMDAMNCSIPSKSVPIKSATPWINRDIRTDIAKRERMFRKAKRSNSQDHLSRYRSLRNSIVSKICEAKKFFEKLSQSTTSNRKFWSIIRSMNPCKPLSTGSLSYGSVSVTRVQDKANLLNELILLCFLQFHICAILLFLIRQAQVRLLLKMLSTDMTVLIKRLRFS